MSKYKNKNHLYLISQGNMPITNRHVKSSSSKLNILQATTVKNAGVLITGNYLQEDISMYVLNVTQLQS